MTQQNEYEEEIKPKSVLSIGDITLTSWVEPMDSLINKFKKILQDKTFREYLGIVGKNKILRASNYID